MPEAKRPLVLPELPPLVTIREPLPVSFPDRVTPPRAAVDVVMRDPPIWTVKAPVRDWSLVMVSRLVLASSLLKMTLPEPGSARLLKVVAFRAVRVAPDETVMALARVAEAPKTRLPLVILTVAEEGSAAALLLMKTRAPLLLMVSAP